MAHVVKVIVPFYTTKLRGWEREALAQTMRMFSPAYPVIFLKSEGLSIDAYTTLYPQAEVIEVSTDWLGTRRGIAGYNEMMMSERFYALFYDAEYILICHLDAWIFRDELKEWCAKGYDLVAAPWPTRPRYNRFPLKQLLRWKFRLFPSKRIIRSQMFGRIGNGGLCLRRVSAFREACILYRLEIERFNRQVDPLYNEDIFWALVPEHFRYPSVETALQFAYDLKPEVCYKLNHRQLPMGCHGFMHKRRIRFWKQFIPCAETCLG